MNTDGNTAALNKHMEEQERGERALTNFTADIEPIIQEVEYLIKRMQELEKDYEGYDFDQEIKDRVCELL